MAHYVLQGQCNMNLLKIGESSECFDESLAHS